VILEDDPEAAAGSALVDASNDSAFRLSKPINLSDYKAWHNIEASCYVDKELPLGLKHK
jgi:hypothetical protein